MQEFSELVQSIVYEEMPYCKVTVDNLYGLIFIYIDLIYKGISHTITFSNNDVIPNNVLNMSIDKQREVCYNVLAQLKKNVQIF